MEKPDYTCIFLNGDPPSPELLRQFCGSTKLRIATDGAYDYCVRLGLKPHILIGDMDSVSGLPEAQNIRVIYDTDINNNDLEKCLKFCREHRLRKLRVFGADGKRIDHFLINMVTLANFAKTQEIQIYSNREYLQFLNPGEYVFQTAPGQRFSLLALEAAGGLQIDGAAYTADRGLLEPGSRGLGNICTDSELKILFSSGLLLYISELSL